MRPRRRKFLFLLGGVLTAVLGLAGARFLFVEYELAQARAALERRDATAALERLQGVRRLDADNAEAHFLTARAYRRQGRLDRVRDHIERAWKAGYPVRRLEREQWLALAQAGQMDQAEPHIRELLLNPGGDGPEICEAFVNGYLRNYRFTQALRIIEAWEADYPQDPQPHVCRGIIAQHLKRWPKAETHLREALQHNPERTDIRLRLAEVLAELHKYDEAEREYRRCLDEEPDKSEALAGWARCLMHQGREEKAGQIFRRIVESEPENFSARLGLGKLALSRGKPQEALEWFEPLVEDFPSNLQVRYSLASAFQAAGRREKASQHFEFAASANEALTRVQRLTEKVMQNPELVKPRYEIGVTLLKYDSPKDGLGWLHSVLNLAPDHQPTHRALAEYYRKQGNVKLARRHARRAKQAGTGEG